MKPRRRVHPAKVVARAEATLELVRQARAQVEDLIRDLVHLRPQDGNSAVQVGYARWVAKSYLAAGEQLEEYLAAVVEREKARQRRGDGHPQ